ncbi:MAG: DUF4389 domain-containing protein [Parvibaculum sp.]
MSDTSTSPEPAETISDGARTEEPLWQRFLYMVAFAILANIAFSVTLFLGVVQFVLLLVRKEKNTELLKFSRNLTAFVGECLSYIVFAREEKPFPLGKFPSIEA